MFSMNPAYKLSALDSSAGLGTSVPSSLCLRGEICAKTWGLDRKGAEKVELRSLDTEKPWYI